MNLYLIGYRGCGKSTVAPLVAKSMTLTSAAWESVDVDDLVEAQAGMTIAAIFAGFGESDFRSRETNVITDVSKRSELVVSLGGGAPIFASNREIISSSGKTVWLRAESNLLWERISADQATEQQRPNLTEKGGLEEVVQLLAERNPVYEACADYTIDVDDLTPQEIADRIVNWLQTDDK